MFPFWLQDRRERQLFFVESNRILTIKPTMKSTLSISILKVQGEKFVAPVVKLNQLNVANLEKLTALREKGVDAYPPRVPKPEPIVQCLAQFDLYIAVPYRSVTRKAELEKRPQPFDPKRIAGRFEVVRGDDTEITRLDEQTTGNLLEVKACRSPPCGRF